MKFKKVNAQAFFPLLNRLSLLLSAGFPIHASSFSSRQLPRSAQAVPGPSKPSFPFRLRSRHFHASTLFNFGGVHGSIFQDASGSQPFLGLFFRTPQFDLLMHQLGVRPNLASLREKLGTFALKARWRSLPLSPVITLFPHTFLRRPRQGADLSWRFPVLSYGDLRLGVHLPGKPFSLNVLPAVSVTFSAEEAPATSPIWSVKNLVYPPSFMATGSAKAAPQTDSSSSERPTPPLSSQGVNNASIPQAEQATHELHGAIDRGQEIIIETENRDGQQRIMVFMGWDDGPIESSPEGNPGDKIKAIEALIRSIHEWCESLELKSLEYGNSTSAKPLLSLLTPFEKGNLTAEEVWQAFNTQHYDSVTLFQALAYCGDEEVWKKIIDLAEETGTQPQLWERLMEPVGEFRTTPLDSLTKCGYEKTAWSQITDSLRGIEAQEVVWEASVKEARNDKTTLLYYWLARYGSEILLTRLIKLAKEIGVQQQLWDLLITREEGGSHATTPLCYWLARYGSASLEQLNQFAKELGSQQLLWENLIKPVGEFRTTSLYWLIHYEPANTLTQLIQLAKSLGAEQQLWESLIKAGGSNKSSPLDWLIRDQNGITLRQLIAVARKIERTKQVSQNPSSIPLKIHATIQIALPCKVKDESETILTLLMNFSKTIGTQAQLWEALIKEEGRDKTTSLYWLARNSYLSKSTLMELIEFAKETGSQKQLWEALIKEEGRDKTTPLYWLVLNQSKTTLTELIDFAKEVGTQAQLWEGLTHAGGSNEASPLYWLVRGGSETTLTELIEFAKETRSQNQLWEALIKEEGNEKTTPLYSLTQSRSETALRQLIDFTKEIGTQAQLWEALIKEEGHEKATPLYWLTQSRSETTLRQLLNFTKEVGTQAQLWEGLTHAGGSNKASPLYSLARDPHRSETTLAQLIEFAKETGTQPQLWEALIKEEGNEKTTPLYWLVQHGSETTLTELIDLAKGIEGQIKHFWDALVKAEDGDAHPLDGAEPSLESLLGLTINSDLQELWNGLAKTVNHFRTIPLYWLTQTWSDALWTKFLELVKEKPQVTPWSALELLVKLQIVRDISALRPPKHSVYAQGGAGPLTREQLRQKQEKEAALFREQERIARDLNRITSRYDAFLDAVLELPPMQASPMLDASGFHFYFHHDSLSKGAVPYGALEMLLSIALNRGASDQIRDKILKIHNIHAQNHKTLEKIVPCETISCAPIADCLFGTAGKRGELCPTFIELLRLKFPQKGLEMELHRHAITLQQFLSNQRPSFEENLQQILIEATSQISEAQTASTQSPSA